MSKKKPLCLWKNDSPQPDWYDKHADPLHGDFAGNEVGDSFGKRLVLAIKAWLSNQNSVSCDEAVQSIKLDWIRQGGSIEVYQGILERAFVASGYYRQLMKI